MSVQCYVDAKIADVRSIRATANSPAATVVYIEAANFDAAAGKLTFIWTSKQPLDELPSYCQGAFEWPEEGFVAGILIDVVLQGCHPIAEGTALLCADRYWDAVKAVVQYDWDSLEGDRNAIPAKYLNQYGSPCFTFLPELLS